MVAFFAFSSGKREVVAVEALQAGLGVLEAVETVLDPAWGAV